MSMPWPRWPLLLASLLAAGPSLAGDQLAPLSAPALGQLRARESSRAAESLTRLRIQKRELGLNERDDFRLSGVQTDRFGLTHARFQQLHQDVPVWGSVAITHMNASGLSLPITAEAVRTGVRLNVQPALDEASAMALATLELAPRGLMESLPKAELVIYPETHRVSLTPDKPFKEQNAVDFKDEVVGYHLAWHVHAELDNAQDGVAQKDFIIDAQSGVVLKQWNALQTAAALGKGNSQYSGQVPLDVSTVSGGGYELRDTTRTYGEGLRTYDINHAAVQSGAPATPVLYTDADNTWGDGKNYTTGAPTLGDNGQTAAVDAHFGLLATWDYYQAIHGRFGIDDLGTPTFNRVHAGTSYDNAFWSDSCFCMTYGDGAFNASTNPSGFLTMTALDVTGHELSHGVMSQTAGLIYAGESGGLNEANSDIFGTMTEFWVRGGRKNRIGEKGGNFYIGEDLNPYFALRYMFKPSLDGASADAWYPGIENVDVHYSSGPMNRAFYFLSQGANPSSFGGDYSSTYLPAGMTGIGNDDAAAIWYRAITVYLFPSANYVTARTASLQAASDLFGGSSPQYHAVEDAFAAINVGYTAGTYDDRTLPTVTVSVSGSAPTLQLNAAATDNVGVARVEFYTEAGLAGTDASLPFSVPLDTTTLTNGTHSLIAVAYDKAGNTGVSAAVSFTVSNSFTQLLQDPGFEQAGLGWEANPRGNINYPVTGAHLGQGYVWLNGYGATSTDNLYQDVTLPAGISKAALTFYLNLTTSETSTTAANDTLVLQVRDTSGSVLKTLATWSNLNANLGWVQRSFDVTEFAGQTVRIYLEGNENASLATNFRLDDFTLRVTPGADTEVPRVNASYVFNTANTQVGLFADVSDNGYVGAVEFILDGTSLGTTPTSFARILTTSSLSNGTHTVVAKATDAAGNVGTSAPVSFVIDTNRTQLVINPSFENRASGPTGTGAWPVTYTLSTALGFYPSASFAHSGSVFFIFYSNPGTNQSTMRQTVTIPATATSAIYSFWLRLYSDAFSDGLVHHTFTAKVRNSSGVDLRTLETFSNLSTTAGKYYEHRYDLSAYKGQTVQLFFDANMLAAPQVSGGVTQYFLDDVTLTTTTTPDTQAPVLSASVDGSYGSVQLNATVSDNVWVSTLEFLVDGASVATRTNASGVYAVPFDSKTVSNGTHQLVVKATDTSGNVSTVTSNFNVLNSTVSDTTPPTVSASVSGTFESTVFTASASDDTGVTHVEFYVDGTFEGTSGYPYQLPFSTLPLSAGEHTLTAVAYDAYGHSKSAAVKFTREGLLLGPVTFVVLPVGGTYTFTASLSAGGTPSVEWKVNEGNICGDVTWTGVYTAPEGSGLCHVTATARSDARMTATATVKVFTGDLSGDHVVDGEDLGLLAQAYGSTSAGLNYSEKADLDSSAAVDDNDVTLFVSQFGR